MLRVASPASKHQWTRLGSVPNSKQSSKQLY